ncbi:MAG: adenylate/guanylate cyclase domain-containing protein [Pseudomonadota bacterium]
MRKFKPSIYAAAALGVVAVLLLALVAMSAAPWLDPRLLDAQFALNRRYFPQAVRNDVVLVGIDEAFLDTVEEPLALSHRYLAQFLDAASGAGATVIALDLVLPEKRFDTLVSTRDPEFDFHRTLLAGLMRTLPRSKLVLAKVWDIERGHYRDIQIDYAAVLNTQQGQVEALASALFCSDDDTRIRRYPDPSWNCLPDRSAHTLASEAAAAMGTRQSWHGLINYQIGAEFNYLPLQEVLRLANNGGQARLRELFASKAVLLGTVQDDTDLVNLPVALASWRPGIRRLPGVLAHAQAVRSMLNNGFIEPLEIGWQWLMALAGALFWFHAAVTRKLLLVLLLSLGLLAASNVLLRQGFWIAPGAMLMSAWLSALSRSAWQAWRHFSEKQRLRRTFAGYVSPQVMQQILTGGVDARRRGSKVEVCVLFSDIRNFTTMSEQLAAEQVVALLNRYFGRITTMVHKHGGTVDKFIGDGMMAFFGAPNELPSAEKAGLEAARDMLAELDELNRELVSEGKAPLAMGIGLHSGPAVIGYIGSSDRHEYTAIGDTVNVASRLEGLCKTLGYPIVCSGAVAERLGNPAMLTPLGEHGLKGHSAVPVYGWDPQGERQPAA